MEFMYPIGSKILHLDGRLERASERPSIKDYSAVISFDDGSTAILMQDNIDRVGCFPPGTEEIPVEDFDHAGSIVGQKVTNVVVCEASENRDDWRRQIFLVLNGMYLMGIVPTARGTQLHIEAALTAPLLRQKSFTTLSGEPISLDEIVHY